MAEASTEFPSHEELERLMFELGNSPRAVIEPLTHIVVDALLSRDEEGLGRLSEALAKPAEPGKANGWVEAQALKLVVDFSLEQLPEDT